MAKYTKRIVVVEAEQFDSTKSQSSWPAGVIVNAKAKSGYSYGTLNEVSLGSGNVKIDGVPINHLDYIVKMVDGIVMTMGKAEFDATYELK